MKQWPELKITAGHRKSVQSATVGSKTRVRKPHSSLTETFLQAEQKTSEKRFALGVGALSVPKPWSRTSVKP